MGYHGYTNYETWKVQLEILDPIMLEKEILEMSLYHIGQELKYIVEETILTPNLSHIQSSCLEVFIEEVNFLELAQMQIDRS